MIEIKDIIKHIVLLPINLMQTIAGVLLITELANLKNGGSEMIFGYFIMLIIFAVVSCFLRGVHHWGLVLGIPELILSPIGIVRWVIGTIGLIIGVITYDIEFEYTDEWSDSPLNNVIKFLFGFNLDLFDVEIGKIGNILTQTFLCCPLAIAETYCFWTFVHQCKTNAFPLLWIITLQGFVLSAFILCLVRKIPTEISYWTGKFTFHHNETGASATIKTSDRNKSYELTDEAESNGWSSGEKGYSSNLTGWFIATLIFSPIIGFTQTIAILFALIAPHAHILSCYSLDSLDIEERSFFQKIPYFFFSFVIDFD